MISLTASGRLRITVPFTPENMSKLRGVPAERRWEGRSLVTECCKETLTYARDKFSEYEWSDDAREKLREAEAFSLAAEEARERRKQLVLDGTFPFSDPPPFAHQKTIFYLSRDSEYFAVFAEQGTGKSRTMVDTAAHLFENGKIDSVLILAPNGVHRNWIEQLSIFFRKDLPYRAEFYASDARVEHKRRLDLLVGTRDESLAILAMNVESLSHDSGLKFALKFVKKRRTLIVVDESQRIKSPSSRRGRNAVKLASLAPYRRVLTGTPVTNGLEDLYNQMLFLSPSILGCSTYTEFKANYCVMGGYEGREIVNYRNVDQLQERLAPHSFHIAKKDCLDLPEKVYVKIPVDLTVEQRQMYRELRDQFITELKSGERITANLALTRLLRLHQIVCGHYSPDIEYVEGEVAPKKGEWKPLANNRMRTCLDIVQESRAKVIVWSRFIPDLMQLRSLFEENGVASVLYTGKIKASERADNLRAFKNDPGIKVFLGTQMAGGVGLTINEAKTTVYYSNSFSLEDRLQSEDRNHRAGQDESVTYYDLYTPGTVDSKILHALKKKQEVANLVKSLEGLRSILSEKDDTDGTLFE